MQPSIANEAASEGQHQPRPRTSRLKRLLGWTILLVIAFILWRVYDIFLGGNFGTVLAGQCYRGAQPADEDLQRIVKRQGVRTVINLRGLQDDEPDELWYPIEIHTCAALGVKLVHIGLWSYTPPPLEEFHKLVTSLAEDPAPFFIHCHSGSDRTGMAAALFLLLRTDTSLNDAKKQLNLYHGHAPWGRARCHDRLFDCYARWLSGQGKEHSPELLWHWAMTVYDEKVD